MRENPLGGKAGHANQEVQTGKTTPQACKEAEITVQTFYRWRTEYGGLKMDQAKRMKRRSVKGLFQHPHLLASVDCEAASRFGSALLRRLVNPRVVRRTRALRELVEGTTTLGAIPSAPGTKIAGGPKAAFYGVYV
jgi:hypothetical protein